MESASVRAIESAAALKDDVSRSIYGFVRRERRSVSRAEAAIYAGVSRKLAAWHLEKLVAKGLLEVVRTNGHGPRSVGRPAKLYSAAADPIELSFPRKRHDLLADVLAQAVESASAAESAREAALRLAKARGATLGQGLRSQLNLRAPAPARVVKLAQAVLEKHGFEPVSEGANRVALGNCPFDPIARQNASLVCRMTQAFVDGLAKGLGAQSVEARLDPAPGRCCVVLQFETEAPEREA
ncbi:MAG: helix-turn-helix transcriptional regulator [Actinomycetota bacterium]